MSVKNVEIDFGKLTELDDGYLTNLWEWHGGCTPWNSEGSEKVYWAIRQRFDLSYLHVFDMSELHTEIMREELPQMKHDLKFVIKVETSGATIADLENHFDDLFGSESWCRDSEEECTCNRCKRNRAHAIWEINYMAGVLTHR